MDRSARHGGRHVPFTRSLFLLCGPRLSYPSPTATPSPPLPQGERAVLPICVNRNSTLPSRLAAEGQGVRGVRALPAIPPLRGYTATSYPNSAAQPRRLSSPACSRFRWKNVYPSLELYGRMSTIMTKDSRERMELL